MWLYILIFLSAVLLCLVAKSLGMQHNKAILTLSMVGLVLFVGLSDMLGGFDRYIYGELYRLASLCEELSGLGAHSR